jgi:hypothetical protein
MKKKKGNHELYRPKTGLAKKPGYFDVKVSKTCLRLCRKPPQLQYEKVENYLTASMTMAAPLILAI